MENNPFELWLPGGKATAFLSQNALVLTGRSQMFLFRTTLMPKTFKNSPSIFPHIHLFLSLRTPYFS